jgi:hypothetical protein
MPMHASTKISEIAGLVAPGCVQFLRAFAADRQSETTAPPSKRSRQFKIPK